MLRIALVLVAVTVLVLASWAEEPSVPNADAAATTTTTRPARARYGGRAGDPPSLPTGLPGFGTPGPPPPPESERAKDAPTGSGAH